MVNPAIEAEQALVSLCRDRKAWNECCSLDVTAFLSDVTVRCWKAIKGFHDSGEGETASASHLRLLGLSRDEIMWCSVDASSEDAETLASHIASAHARRQLQAWAKDLHERKMDVEEFLSKQEAIRDSLSPAAKRDYDFADQWYEGAAESFKRTGNFSTGFRIFDSIHRWVPSNIYLLTADTGKGKSFLADALMAGFCNASGHKGMLVTLEMNREQRAMRWLKGYSKEELANFYMPKRTSWDLNGIIKEFRDGLKAGFKFFVLDHFHLIPNTTRMSQTEFEAHAVRAFERLADNSGAVFLIVCQMSKHGAKSGAASAYTKHDIKGSKALSDAAAGVFIIDRGEDADALIVDKNRFFGDNKIVGLIFDWKILRPHMTDMDSARKEKQHAQCTA